jgi:hypothetical protein
MIKYNIYNYHVQKSRVFCYSILGIKKGALFTPVETHMALSGHYAFEDCRLILHYDKCDDKNFDSFSENIIMKTALYEKFIVIDKSQRLYIFDFAIYKTDWTSILNGKYSAINYSYKKRIEDYYAKDYVNKALVSKIIYPLRHFHKFAALVNVSPEIVREVGEVLDLPCRYRETLEISQITNKRSISII